MAAKALNIAQWRLFLCPESLFTLIATKEALTMYIAVQTMVNILNSVVEKSMDSSLSQRTVVEKS